MGEELMPRKAAERRIDYVEFCATDLPRTRAFYRAAFGWRFTDYGPEYMAFRDGRLDGGFRKVKRVRRGGPLVVIYTADLERLETRVRKAGGAIVVPIFPFPGGRRFQFTDPDGNELAVWSDRPARR